MNAEIRQQEKLNTVEERNRKLLEKYIAKMLYRQNDKKFENKYLKNLERNQQKLKSVSLEEKP